METSWDWMTQISLNERHAVRKTYKAHTHKWFTMEMLRDFHQNFIEMYMTLCVRVQHVHLIIFDSTLYYSGFQFNYLNMDSLLG